MFSHGRVKMKTNEKLIKSRYIGFRDSALGFFSCGLLLLNLSSNRKTIFNEFLSKIQFTGRFYCSKNNSCILFLTSH